MTEKTKRRVILAVTGGLFLCAGAYCLPAETQVPPTLSPQVIALAPQVKSLESESQPGVPEEIQIVILEGEADPEPPLDKESGEQAAPEPPLDKEPGEQAAPEPSPEPTPEPVAKLEPEPLLESTPEPSLESSSEPEESTSAEGTGTYVEGFGWVPYSGPNEVIYAADMFENGNKVGTMGGG